MKKLILIIGTFMACCWVAVFIMSCDSTNRADAVIKEADEIIERAESRSSAAETFTTFTETKDFSEISSGTDSDEEIIIIEEETELNFEPETPDIYTMDVWDLGLYLYDISYLDTSRALKLITYEGYGYSPLSYYVACCCWTRATENYWGYDNLFSAFGEADTSYDTWMDGLEIADWAYDALCECYLDPMYVRYCNGVIEPEDYIYCEFDGAYWIYVWN